MDPIWKSEQLARINERQIRSMLNARAVIITLFLLVLVASCYYDNAELLQPGSNVKCNTINARFVDVQPIISAKCAVAGCHDATTAAGNTVLQTFQQISGKADRIYIRSVIEKSMPPVQPLSTHEAALLNCWINSGSPNN